MYSNSIGKLIPTYCCIFVIFVNAYDDSKDVTIVDTMKELHTIRNRYVEQMKDYIVERKEEVDKLLNRSKNKLNFLKDINHLEKWWKIDLERRLDVILSNLPILLSELDIDETADKLTQDLLSSLAAAETFWQNETEKILENLRHYPMQMFTGLSNPLVFTKKKSPPLKLGPKYKIKYNKQIRNLTNIAIILKNIVNKTLEQIQPQLPDKNEITYISYKTKCDMIIDKFHLEMNELIDSTKNIAEEKVAADWRKNKYGPSQKAFDQLYSEFNNSAIEILQHLVDDIKSKVKLEKFRK